MIASRVLSQYWLMPFRRKRPLGGSSTESGLTDTMALVPLEELWPKLEELGEEEVRRRLTKDVYRARKLSTVKAWLDEKERERQEGNPLPTKSIFVR